MDERLDFLFLTEEEAVQAGAKDMPRCIEVMDEMFSLLGQGDYLMGTPNQNAHGIKIYFPKETPFPNMPVKGPDRRFMALVAYLGGRFNVCGEKWYGSNIANRDRGLPRSILTTLLNDPDTGAPIAFLSANALSSTRTGAIPAVGAKYFAKNNIKVLSEIGAGVIGRACVAALMAVLKQVEEIRIYDINQEAAQKYCQELSETAGAVSPEIHDEWLKEGVLLTLPASAGLSLDTMKSSRIVVDNWKMYEAYAQELRGLPGGYAANLSGICGYLMDLVESGEIPQKDIVNLGDVIAGKQEGRRNDQERVIFIMDGMPIEDLAWGYTVYENAKEMGLGTKLNLWEKTR